nr:helix-turn-helix domain-containing protein [Kitasatospora sp. SID7827]
MALWRARRAVGVEELAVRTGISPDRLADLEGGREWVDRRGELAALAGALRLDAGELTGQPYSPAGDEHTTVRAVAFHLRRELAGTSPAPPIGSVDDLDERTARVLAAEAAGDEHALALALPGLIRLGDALVEASSVAARQRAAELRVRGHVAAAGLLRRLGYRDLAWTLLHRARPGGPEPVSVLAEEARLLIDMGMPEFALARTERARGVGGGLDLPLLEALANAAAGRRAVAERLLRQALAQAQDARERSAVSAAYAVVAAEAGAADEVVEHARATDLGTMEAAGRARLLVTAASAHTRLGREEIAVRLLVQAEAEAPLRVRLAPFARELLAVLPSRVDRAAAEEVHWIAERAGMR